MSMCAIHSLHLITFAGKLAGCTLARKQCLDFRRLESDQTESESLHSSTVISSESRRGYSR